ncbi:hypothetical protein C8R43DRAFT_1128093 [Mycena crocata]|nr:hypothetical protein C8R43DRAFT_1128093 [Mycena crocata]
MADTFQIFTKGDRRNLRGIIPKTKHDPVYDYGTLVAYTDGPAVNASTTAKRMPESARECTSATMTRGTPIQMAAEICPPSISLEVKSNSRVSINALTKNLPKAEDNGFFDVENKELTLKTLSDLRQREATTSFTWLKGHDGDEGNEAKRREEAQ